MNTKFLLSILFVLATNKRSKHQSNSGFTLIEVIVAVLILTIFILTSLTALVAGLNLKRQAKLNNEATLFIQEDLEKVRYASTQFGIQNVSNVSLTASNTTSPLALTVNLTLFNNTNYLSNTAASSQLKIGNESAAYKLTTQPSATASSLSVTANVRSATATTTKLASALTLGATPSSITVADATQIQNGDRLIIGPPDLTVLTDNTVFTNTVAATNGISGSTVNFTAASPALTKTYPVGTQITILPRARDAISDLTICTSTTNNIAIAFKSFVDNTSNIPIATTYNNQRYQLTRTATVAQDSKTVSGVTSNVDSTTRVQLVYDVKQVYTASPLTVGPSLATLTTEVIPSVAFQCPTF